MFNFAFNRSRALPDPSLLLSLRGAYLLKSVQSAFASWFQTLLGKLRCFTDILEAHIGVPNESGYILTGPVVTAGVQICNGNLCLSGSPSARVYGYNVGVPSSSLLGRFYVAGVFQNLEGTALTGSG
jgi:hypothetical protein